MFEGLNNNNVCLKLTFLVGGFFTITSLANDYYEVDNLSNYLGSHKRGKEK